MTAVGGLLGLCLSAGVLLLWSSLVRRRSGDLEARIGPYISGRTVPRAENQAARRRGWERRASEQLPAVVDLIAFALASGEPLHGAIRRVSDRVDGPLATELEIVARQSRRGVGLEQALKEMAERRGAGSVIRLVDGLLLAIERESSVADLVRTQAAETRDDARRRSLTLAARREVAMLVPVMLIVMPTVAGVALFPGLAGLHLVAP